MEYVLSVLMGYTIGSAPVVFLIAKARGVDLRESGTGNLGGGNLWAQTGNWTGAAGMAVDLAKGPAAVLLVRGLGLGVGAEAISAVAAVSGQMWPFTLGFRGGRGNLTAGGGLLALSPLIGLLGWVVLGALMSTRLLNVFTRQAPMVGTTSRITPIAALAGIGAYGSIALAVGNLPVAGAGGAVLALVLVRRVTAPWPRNPETGVVPKRSIVSALLFDRPAQPAVREGSNTSSKPTPM